MISHDKLGGPGGLGVRGGRRAWFSPHAKNEAQVFDLLLRPLD